jgi:hypothetical protein
MRGRQIFGYIPDRTVADYPTTDKEVIIEG